MAQRDSAYATRATGSSVVLLARIVDGAGRPIRPSQVAAIEYLISARGVRRAEFVSLTISDVLLPTLVNDDAWSVDVAGYNFRHEIAIGEGVAVPKAGGPIKLCYVFSRPDDTKEIFRFRLKVA